LPALVLFAITILCNLPLLRSTPLAGTEGHRAITAEQMIREGNWILPKLFDRYYLAKPPMQYWLIALCHFVARTGNELVWRMPGIIAAALLNAVLCLFGGRWFGRVGAWVAGWSGFGLIALWGQVPSADVDSVDTFFAILASLPMLELLFGKPRILIGWVLLAGVSMGAMLLTKGPAGMLPIAGVLLWGVALLVSGWITRRNTGQGLARALLPPDRLGWRWAAMIAALLIGVGIFGAYLAVASWQLRHSPLPIDLEGVQEGTKRLLPTADRFAQSLLVPPELFLFTLPISLSLLMLPVTEAALIAGGGSPGPSGGSAAGCKHAADVRRMANALAGATLLSWLVALITATENPRWVYTTLPLLCPLAGAVVAGAIRLPNEERKGVWVVFYASILLYAAAAIAFTVQTYRAFGGGFAPRYCLEVAIVAVGAAGCACLALRKNRLASAGSLAAIALVLATVPFTIFNRLDRVRRSGQLEAAQLAEIIGPGGVIGSGRMTVSEPELLYYAGANVRHFVPTRDTTGRTMYGPATSPGFVHGWVIAFPDELKTWREQGSITDVHTLKVGKIDVAYVGWFDAGK
jgi:4-amino-4-deoxy-L-arabinose transferase-like glycosyltransferase